MQVLAPAVLALALSLAAQEPPVRPPAQGPVLVDQVIATVNDSPILLSDLRDRAAGSIRTFIARAGKITPKEHQLIYRKELDEIIDTNRMAQAVKSFGVLTPEQIESAFQREIAREEQDLLRDMGSYPKIGDQLKNMGHTWQSYRSEQRVEKMADFAKEFAVGMRLQKQSNLYLTPRMLRETYDNEQRDHQRFVHVAMAQVCIVVFRGADAMATAERAAATWRSENLTGRELADRCEGAIALDEVLASSLAPQFGAITTFALAGPLHSVSAPIDLDGVCLAKVTGYVAARNATFADPKVQEELRDLCRHRVSLEFYKQAIERAKLRTEVWEAPEVRLAGPPAR